ncbi:MARVEL (membrane-associating) domain containing 1 [Mus musculus]|nr:MARVEL (membrane-associating) domain containing 1 [Mus musculus]
MVTPVCFFGIKFVLSDLVFGSHGLVLCGNFLLGSLRLSPCLLGEKGK